MGLLARGQGVSVEGRGTRRLFPRHHRAETGPADGTDPCRGQRHVRFVSRLRNDLAKRFRPDRSEAGGHLRLRRDRTRWNPQAGRPSLHRAWRQRDSRRNIPLRPGAGVQGPSGHPGPHQREVRVRSRSDRRVAAIRIDRCPASPILAEAPDRILDDRSAEGPREGPRGDVARPCCPIGSSLPGGRPAHRRGTGPPRRPSG